ncbi:MAG: hypothetical protein Q7T56_00360 [Nocardioidaceae bacterium]|nr:hypothetical protein [Nocardioidaceae bacterium]
MTTGTWTTTIADASPPPATAGDVRAAIALARSELEGLSDVGTWVFMNLSRLRLPYWSAARRALVRDGLEVEAFVHTPGSSSWRWAEPAAHGNIEVPDRPLARDTAAVLDRLAPDDVALLHDLLHRTAQDDRVHGAVVHLRDDHRVVSLLARGSRLPSGEPDVVLGFAVAGPVGHPTPRTS